MYSSVDAKRAWRGFFLILIFTVHLVSQDIERFVVSVFDVCILRGILCKHIHKAFCWQRSFV